MESIFVLEEGLRAAFLKQIMQSFGCVYVCVWSYLPPPSNCLLALDGLYGDGSNQPSQLAARLFDVYRESVVYVDTGRIPGFAFKNNITYMELKLHEFQRLVSNELQLQFYQEAGIKTTVFMGCATGEIELGLPNDPQVDLERELKNMIPHSDPNQPPSSSSSSLRSLSVDSPEYSPLLFNIPSTSFLPEPSKAALSEIRNVQFPTTLENEEAAMTKAILAVLTSPSSQDLPPVGNLGHNNPSAFRRYRRAMPLTPSVAIPVKQNKFKRAVLFFRNMRRQELQVQGNRPTATQLHHMISERRRREKLNESFHVLRSLLPPGSKKDKASVLSSTTEYLSSLRSQVEELSRRNQMLESQLSVGRPKAMSCSDSVERINVEITQVSSSTSEARYLDVRVTVRGGRSSMLDLVVRLMEFLKQQQNLTLLSLESNTRMLQTTPVHGLMLRFKIQGDEFDESGFQEGVRKAVDEQPL